MKRLDSILGHVTTFLGAMGGLVILFLMALTIADVTKRKLTGQGVPGALEITEVFLVICVFLGIAAAQRTGAHVATTVLSSRLSEPVRRIVTTSFGMVALVVVLFMLIASTETALRSVATGEFRFGLVHVPIWPARLMVPIGLVLFVLEFISTLVKTWTGEETAEDLEAREGDAHVHL